MLTADKIQNIARKIANGNEPEVIILLNIMEQISHTITIEGNGGTYYITLNQLINVVGEKLQNKTFPHTIEGLIEKYNNKQLIIENEDIITETKLATIIQWIMKYYSILTSTPETKKMLETFIYHLICSIASCPIEVWYKKLSRLSRGSV